MTTYPYAVKIFFATLTAIVVVGVAVTAILSIVFTANSNSIQQYATVSISNSSGAQIIGSTTTDVNSRQVSWYYQYTNPFGPVVYLHILGPIPAGQTIASAPLLFSLCGSPSTLACDNTVPNVVQGTANQLSPSGDSLKAVITQMRQYPILYGIEGYGATGGVFRSQFTSVIGVPV
jgi:hypothetical protein